MHFENPALLDIFAEASLAERSVRLYFRRAPVANKGKMVHDDVGERAAAEKADNSKEM